MNPPKKTVKVNANEMPVSCPQKDSPSWNMHPRVYIHLDNKDGADCPYCGTHFELESA